MLNEELLEIAKKVKSLAEIGLVYQDNPYDMERYTELRELGSKMMALLVDTPVEKIKNALPASVGYITPNVDVRAVVFNEKEELLLVKEKVDGCWSLPGGWADIGYTPGEIAVKETEEEAGIRVKTNRLLAVMDKRCHPHPPDVYYVYKIFILCDIVNFEPERGHETEEIGFFDMETLPELSIPRNTRRQLQIIHDLYKNPEKPPYFD